MSAVLPAPRLSEVAPELVRRLGWIVAGMAALVARRFLRDPKFSGLILPLWGWLHRSARRFGRVRVQGRPAAAPAVAPVAAPASRQREPRVTRVRLPSARGWLVRALGWEAAGYGCQLEALLAEPEMVTLLAQVPAMGRILRPLGRMLGVGPVRVATAVAGAGAVARKVVVRKSRPKPVRIPLPGSTRPFICGPRPRVSSRK